MADLKKITAARTEQSTEQVKGKAAQPKFNSLAPRSTTTRTLARTAVLSTLVGIGLSAIASDRLHPAPTQKKSDHSQHHWFEIGKASWYGRKFDGHRTASGEKFDMHELTCAHRTLPLGSWVRITNLRNHKTVFVRVNDRGPMIDDRVVDLSYAAAHAVGLGGVAKVKIEPVRPDDPEMARQLTAQLKMPSPLIAMGR